MKNNNNSALAVLISVFFFWGFVAASNDILIPVFKDELNLTQLQSQMVSFAFYIAYTVGSLIYLFVSTLIKKDVLSKLGYKVGISLGLVISALGTLMFIPAASYESFTFMLSGLFIVGLGFSLQQTAANPLVITIGDPKKGSQRLSMAGGINNIGTTIGPVLISLAIFGVVSGDKPSIGMDSIMVPYLLLGLAFLVVAIIIYFSNIPNQLSQEFNKDERDGEKTTILDHPHLFLGMIAIFVYVGVEVATAGNLGEYLKREYGMQNSDVTPYVSLFWASLMIGRWTSASGIFTTKKSTQQLLSVLLPYGAFGIFVLVNTITNQELGPLYYYAFMIVLVIIGDWLSKGNPARQLMIYSALGIAALLIGMYFSGLSSIYAIISVGLFCSTLWPCIFTLAIAGLGSFTNKASGYLIMMIMGGGIISLLQGFLADQENIGIKNSFWVGVGCFAYLFLYAVISKRILQKKGIHYDA